ncbi:hypothetical protein, partial [Streptomyces sp. NPDC000931]|uniref:hypothetical protein n=1 Tax=Streptomyces sp. NPDC000931 TaxID=3154372 RepID=UPI003327FF67
YSIPSRLCSRPPRLVFVCICPYYAHGISPTERMSSLVRRHVNSGWRHRSAIALSQELLPTLRAIHPVRHREISSLHRTYREHVREIIVAGVTADQFRIRDTGRATDSVLETFDSLLHWYDPGAGLSLNDLGGVYVDLVIHHHLRCPR